MIDIKELEKAIILTKSGRKEEAEEIYKKLLEKNPENGVLLSAAGLFYNGLKKYEKASGLLEKAYEIKKTFGTISAYGLAEFGRKNFGKAAMLLKEALEYGQRIDIYDKLVTSLFEIDKFKEAVEYADKMFELYPDEERAIAAKIRALVQSGKILEAEKMCVENIKKNPEASPMLWFNLGYLKELMYHDDRQAIECYRKAAKLGASNADYNIAVAYGKLGEYKKSEKYYKRMLKKFPDDDGTKCSIGMCYLAQKKFKKGYGFFYFRDPEVHAALENDFWLPGEKIKDEIVIISEQGLGDHIQFIRYLPFFNPNKRKVKFVAAPPLKKLFSMNYPDIDFINSDEINPKAQAMCVADLAYILNMDFDHIPFSGGYLKPEYVEDIKCDKPKVGLCWEAKGAGIRGMINRSINIKCFEQILNLKNIQVYSFQVDDTLGGNEKYPQMINLAKDFKDFADTARALKAMDVLVTVDTSVLHLAGALGVKTYLLLPYAPDWRWFDDNKTTPWYDSVEIFKQTDKISWEEQINDITERLKKLS